MSWWQPQFSASATVLPPQPTPYSSYMYSTIWATWWTCRTCHECRIYHRPYHWCPCEELHMYLDGFRQRYMFWYFQPPLQHFTYGIPSLDNVRSHQQTTFGVTPGCYHWHTVFLSAIHLRCLFWLRWSVKLNFDQSASSLRGVIDHRMIRDPSSMLFGLWLMTYHRMIRNPTPMLFGLWLCSNHDSIECNTLHDPGFNFGVNLMGWLCWCESWHIWHVPGSTVLYTVDMLWPRQFVKPDFLQYADYDDLSSSTLVSPRRAWGEETYHRIIISTSVTQRQAQLRSECVELKESD